MTEPTPYYSALPPPLPPPVPVRSGFWLADLVVAWALIGLLAIASIVLDLLTLFAAGLMLMCADDETGASCQDSADLAGHAMGTLGLEWLPVVAAAVGVGMLARRRLAVFWIPLVAAVLSLLVVVVGVHTIPAAGS